MLEFPDTARAHGAPACEICSEPPAVIFADEFSELSMEATTLLEGKTALVTGGAGGLGRAIARALQHAGAQGTIVDLDVSAAASGAPVGWRGLAVDVRDEASLAASVQATLGAFGGLDIVVVNAGVVPPWCETEHIILEEWDRTFAVNVRGVVATIKAAIPVMKRAGGSIIALGSEASYNGHQRQAAYVATKHAVLGIVRSAALDLGRYNIRVNAVAPGPIATDALLGRVAARAATSHLTSASILQKYIDATSLGRMVIENEVASVVSFLASDLALGTTGVVLPIDAGAG
jgi:NAD(P)-dependent dehydrogenase (short-subunit alcohol dehydrogenase family)